MERLYFVSGIDTGIGKTVATGLMAKWLLHKSIDAITFKLVQTGNTGASEDIDEHRRICGGIRFHDDDAGLTAPQIFAFPSSPALAASLEGKIVDLSAIDRAATSVASNHEVTLVESAGGLHVPLTTTTLSIDFAASHGWPLILVTCGRLGAINHTLLSIEAALSRNMRIAGVIHNWFPNTDPRIDADAISATRQFLSLHSCNAPIVTLPHIDTSAGASFPIIDFSPIFK